MNYITSRYHSFDSGYLTLRDLQLSGLPKTIRLEGETFPIQLEHHITLVDTTEIAAYLNSSDSQQVAQQISALFVDFESKHHMDSYELVDKFYVVEKDNLKSVIVECRVPNLSELFDQIETYYGSSMPRQYPHITLYARNNAGIALPSTKLLHQLARPVVLPELADISCIQS